MTVEQSKEAPEKLAEALPFWKGALASCRDQGLDAHETQELLVKCAQVDPILEEELIQIKQAGGWDWLTQPLSNAGRFIGGMAETAAGGIGGAGAAVWGAGEAATDALGWTDPITNTGFDTAGTMFQASGAGIKNMGRSVGVEGAMATTDHGATNYVTDLHEKTMDRAGYTDDQKWWSRKYLAGGRRSANLAATFAVPGVLASAGVGMRAAGSGARLAGLGRGALTGIRGTAPTLVSGASPFAPIAGARLALLTQPGARFLQVGARNPLMPMTGLPGAAGYGGTAATATGAPMIAEGAGYALSGAGRVLGWARVPGARFLSSGGAAIRGAVYPGMAPAGAALVGVEAGQQALDQYVNKPAWRALDPGATHSPHTYSDAKGLDAYAVMPYKNRPTIGPENEEIRLPGKEVWPEALLKAQTDPNYGVGDAFAASLVEFQRNGGAEINPGNFLESARDRSLGHVLPFDLQNIAYADTSPPVIALDDPAAALDFVDGPLEGFVNIITEEQSKTKITDMFATRGLEVNPDQVMQLHTEFMASPQGATMIAENRMHVLDELVTIMDPVQHKSLLDVYSARGVSMQLSDVPEVHIPAPQQPPPVGGASYSRFLTPREGAPSVSRWIQ